MTPRQTEDVNTGRRRLRLAGPSCPQARPGSPRLGDADPPVVHSRPEQGWRPGPRRRQPRPHGTFRIARPRRRVTRLRNPGELLAALPYLIGFHPRDSLLFIAFGGSSGRRIELDAARRPAPGGRCGRRLRRTRGEHLRVSPAGVAVVVVGGDRAVAGGVPFGGPPPLAELAAVAEATLTARGVPVQSCTWAAGTDTGAAWACYDECGCRGAVPDEATTPFAATAVAAGLVARADRAELEKLVAPTTPGRLRRRARMLTRAVDAGSTWTPGLAARPGRRRSPARWRRRRGPTGHALVENALADAAAGRLCLDDARVVALALALSDLEVRDAALARSAGRGRGRGRAPVGRARPGDAGSGGRRARGAACRLRAAAR